MNLFRLHDDPVLAAQLNQDLHVRKIVLENCQLLANCYSINQLQNAPKTQTGNVRKYSHVHHPVSKHVKESFGNFNWALKHGLALCAEFEYRFGKKHFCEEFIKWAAANKPELVKDGGETEFPQCFKQYPQCIVVGKPVEGYKNYYRTAKKMFDFHGNKVFATWTKREKPEFMN